MKIQILGKYYNLKLVQVSATKTRPSYNLNNDFVEVEVWNPENYEKHLEYLYTNIFYEYIVDELKKIKNELGVQYNNFKMKHNQKMPVKINFNNIKSINIETTKICNSCGLNMKLCQNKHSGQYFYVCRNSHYASANMHNDKDGIEILINPKFLCSQNLEKIKCDLYSNLIQIKFNYNSVPYWKELLKYCPNYFEQYKIDQKTKSAIKKNLRLALDEIIKDNSNNNDVDYEKMKNDILKIIES